MYAADISFISPAVKTPSDVSFSAYISGMDLWEWNNNSQKKTKTKYFDNDAQHF